ncbi:hypothetical protein DINM_002769 [Dirofilaria immitis]|nr:hypothetical protein [Dirofilaria immitis]
MYFFAISETATERSRDDVAWRHLPSGKRRFVLTVTVLDVTLDDCMEDLEKDFPEGVDARYAVMVVACCSCKLRDDGVIVQGKYMQYEQSEVSSSISNIIFNREWIRSNPILMKLLINNLFNKKLSPN